MADTTAGSVASARESLAAARADLPALELTLIEQQNRMDVLAGDLPRSTAGPGVALPTAPPQLRGGAGVPATLLSERPDIRAAAARLIAANANIRVAVGDRLPGLTLTGRLQSSGDGLADLLDIDNLIASLVTDLTATLFDGGRGSRLVAMREAEARALAEDYVATVLQAVEEVENALAAERLLAMQAARQRERLEAAREATQIAGSRYAAGTGQFLTLLDASSAELTAETAYLQVQERRWQARIDLHLALGGQWVPAPAPDQVALAAEAEAAQ
ncbi:TolC family protein [Aestuariivita sp.]|uniref:TolC family protein n=1 Tax=Aestuariivita sp. TaxID=1872407 RepID=UPI00216C48B4|nr:TolC family protein [Aestuariivita sp.]MCE8006868.1 TolC family protein [Aestuariivita sp.]